MARFDARYLAPEVPHTDAGAADDQHLARRVHNIDRHRFRRVDFEDTRDLGQQADDQPQITTGDAENLRQHVRGREPSTRGQSGELRALAEQNPSQLFGR